MSSEEMIKQLQKRIDAISSEMRQIQEQLDQLHGEAPQESIKRPGNSSLENLIGLRFMHIAGIIVLVAGVSIGVKYAIDQQLIAEWLRIVLAYAVCIVLLILSFRLKEKYERFSAILFSGSMASFYFTTYAAFVYYQFIPGPLAFLVMTALTAYTVYTAITYNRQEIAVLGMVGAYGIPFLISQNSERIDLFFAYILLINLGVSFIAFRKSWRTMQYMALLITWTLMGGWAFFRSQPTSRTIGSLFMSAYFVLFLVAAMAQRLVRRQFVLAGESQQILINNIAVYISAVLIFSNGFLSAVAPVTGIIAAVISVQALLAARLLPSELTLQKVLAWQALVFIVLYVGVKWSGLTVTFFWLVLAIALFTWGVYLGKSWPRLCSILLIALTLGKLILFDSERFSTIQKIISFLFIGALLLAFSFYYQRHNLQMKGKEED
jgi:uncharacterized membrane protein